MGYKGELQRKIARGSREVALRECIEAIKHAKWAVKQLKIAKKTLKRELKGKYEINQGPEVFLDEGRKQLNESIKHLKI